jgi:hypothetical protein
MKRLARGFVAQRGPALRRTAAVTAARMRAVCPRQLVELQTFIRTHVGVVDLMQIKAEAFSSCPMAACSEG